jgi:hypothetical protein
MECLTMHSRTTATILQHRENKYGSCKQHPCIHLACRGSGVIATRQDDLSRLSNTAALLEPNKFYTIWCDTLAWKTVITTKRSGPRETRTATLVHGMR